MDVDANYMYCNIIESAYIRVYDKETREQKTINVGALTHILKIFDDYLILIDNEELLVFEKK